MKWFREEEFQCQCGCGITVVDEVKSICDTLRDTIGSAVVINSGARCESHNKHVGGSDSSSHVKGLAVDIKATDSVKRFQVIRALLSLGIARIGVSDSFIHFDIDREKSQGVIWTY